MPARRNERRAGRVAWVFWDGEFRSFTYPQFS
jgi:hypothetical protein